MIRFILGKLFIILFGNNRRTINSFTLTFLGILMTIRTFWRPIEYFAILIIILILYRKISKLISKPIESKLSDINNLMQLLKFDQALEKIEEVISKDLPEIDDSKKKRIYKQCIYDKANCLQYKINKSGNIEEMKECIRLYEEAYKLTLEENKPAGYLVGRLGLSYYNLGAFENDKKLLEKAIEVLEAALEESKDGDKQLIKFIRIILGSCYREAAKYSNRLEYLKKSLKEFDYALDESYKEKDQCNNAINLITRASVLRMINELEFNETYKTKAIDDLNKAIKYLNDLCKKYNKRYFASRYIVQRYNLAVAYFEMFKLDNSNSYIKDYRKAIREVKEYSTKESRPFFIKKVNEMLNELI